MAQATGKSVTTTGTGASDWLQAPEGEWVLIVVWSGSAGDLDIQMGDGTTFFDMLDSSDAVVNVTDDYGVIVAGGVAYRADVNTHTSAATLTLHRSRKA